MPTVITPDVRAFCVGHLRKGGPKKPNAPGANLQFFRFEPDARVRNPEVLKQKWQKLFGKTPGRGRENAILVRPAFPKLFSDALAPGTLDEWFEQWTDGILLRRCTGEEIVLELHGEKYFRLRKGCPRLEGHDCDCRIVARVNFVVPEFTEAGFVTLHTTSMHDVRTVKGVLMAAYHVAQVNGIPFTGVEFNLWREPVRISYPNKGGRQTREEWVVRLAPASGNLFALPQPESADGLELEEVSPEELPAPPEDVVVAGGVEEPDKA